MVLPVLWCAARPRGVEGNGRAAHYSTGRQLNIVSAMSATKHNVTERNGSVAEGTTRASTKTQFLREVWSALKQSWSGAECSEAEEH